MSKLIIGLFLFSLLCFTQATINPPYYGQHDSEWGSETLGQSSTTISSKGCLLTTMASMIAYKGITVSGGTANPSTMNRYFLSKKMFSGGILFYKAPVSLGFTYEGIVTSKSAIVNAINAGKFAHLHVLNGRHWVLATGVTSSGYSVMDPGSAKTTSYKYSDVVGCAIYSYSSSENLSEEAVDSSNVPAENISEEAVDSSNAPSENLSEEAVDSSNTNDALTKATINAPYLGQMDSRWGKRTLGQGPTTISRNGCLLTTMTSMIAYKGIEVNGAIPDVGTMNTYFLSKKMFSGDIIFYKAPTSLGFTFEGIVTSKSAIVNAMNAGKFAHLHVKRGTHWVLATGVTSSGYTVMDPASTKTTTYKYSDVVGCAVYSYSSSSRNLSEESEESVDSSYADDVLIEDFVAAAPASSSHSEHSKPRYSSKAGNLRKQSAN